MGKILLNLPAGDDIVVFMDTKIDNFVDFYSANAALLILLRL